MEFPLDIITGLLTEQGIEVVKEPKHPKERFAWVSAFCDEDALRSEETTVYVVDRDTSSPPEMFRLFVLKPSEDLAFLPEPGPGPDDIVIRTACSCPLIADRIQRYLTRIIQWNDQMGAMIEAGCINQDLLRASEPILKCYVGLTDATFSYIAHTPGIPPIDDQSAYLIEHRCYSPEAISQAQERGLMHLWEHQDWTAVHAEPNDMVPYPTLDRVIKQHGSYAAHLLLVSPTKPTGALVFLFDLLAHKVEQCLAHHWRLENPLEQRYTYFLKDVLLGNIADEGQLIKRAEAHGLPLKGLFEVCLADNTWRAGSPDYFAKMVLEIEPDCKVAINGPRVAVLLCSPDLKPGRIAAVEESLFDLAHRLHLEMGVSDKFEHLSLAALSLEKARIALKYGRRKSQRYVAFDSPEARNSYIFRFRRYFAYFVTDPYERSERFTAKLLASPNPLARLREADRERGTDDAEILRVFLHSEGRINLVCEQLHMHRNTVNYRLDKIRAVIDGDLDDPDMRMYLRMLLLITD